MWRSVSDLARDLAVAPSRIRSWVAAGHIPGARGLVWAGDLPTGPWVELARLDRTTARLRDRENVHAWSIGDDPAQWVSVDSIAAMVVPAEEPGAIS